MTEQEAEKLAIEAAQALDLKSDPAFQRAVLLTRSEALNGLAKANPDDGATIRTLQAEIKAIDGLCQKLADAITRAPRATRVVA